MTLTQAAPKKLSKEVMSKLTLDDRNNFNPDLKSIEK